MPFPKFPARIVYPNLNNSTGWWCIHLVSSELWIIGKKFFYLDTENKAQIEAEFWNLSPLEQKTNSVAKQE